jgi:GNAT superfamily N-acetyltransferase
LEFEIDIYRDDEIETSVKVATKAFSVYEPIGPIFSPEFFRYLWTMPDIDRDLLLSARIEGKVVGQTFVLPRKTRVGNEMLDIGTVAVVGTDPAYKRKGIARALMKKAVKIAEEKGYHGLTLFTNPPWNAYKLYESLGFKTFYTTKLQLKILDAKTIAKAMGVGYMAPFMKLKAGVKEKPLPPGFRIRGYEEGDRHGCVEMVNEYSNGFDYSEEVSVESWKWWQESMSEKLHPRSFVMEKNGELVGAISSYTAGTRAKGKKGDMVFQLGNVGNFCYKPGYEEHTHALLSRVLNEQKKMGIPATANGFSPSIFQPTELFKTVWKKQGFIQNKDYELRFMYKSFDPRFKGLESMKTFFYQPF